MGAELEKGRNLWAETSGGQIRKGPKPLATKSINILFALIILLENFLKNVFLYYIQANQHIFQ